MVLAKKGADVALRRTLVVAAQRRGALDPRPGLHEPIGDEDAEPFIYDGADHPSLWSTEGRFRYAAG